jgi:hypothetical protein
MLSSVTNEETELLSEMEDQPERRGFLLRVVKQNVILYRPLEERNWSLIFGPSARTFNC